MKSDKEFWELRTKKYGEKAVGNLSDPLWDKQENLLRWYAIKKSLNFKKGQKALEVGTGTGNCAIKLAKKGLIVSACDISQVLINIAEQKAKKSEVDIDFFCLSVKDILFPPNTFDIVISVTVLQHITDIYDFKQSLKKISNVVKKDGIIAIIEYSPKKLSQSFEERLQNAELMVSRTRNEWINEFESQGMMLYGEKGIRFFGYHRGKKYYIYLRNKIKEKLFISRKPLSDNTIILTRLMIYWITLLIDYILSQFSSILYKTDTRLLIFKKI